MGTLNETPVWEAGVRHFEANAVLTGGPDCPDNLPLSDLANRTAWLRQQVEAAQGGLAGHEAAADPHPQYATDADLVAHAAAADPHPVYLTSAEGDAKIAAAVAALVNGSPAALDTLAELATALGNDQNFATTITNALATKLTQAQGDARYALLTALAGYALKGANNDITALNAVVSGSVFRKNAIINGNFDFWQRGTTPASPAGGVSYTADRWVLSSSVSAAGPVLTVSRQAFALGQAAVPNEPSYYASINSATVANLTGLIFRQRIEGVRSLAGKTVTLSFYATSSTNAVLPAVSYTQGFGTGGAPSAQVNAAVANNVALNGNWQKFTYTFAVPSIAGKTIGTNGDDFLEIAFTLPSNAAHTVAFAQVQLEEGSVATSFDARPLAHELLLCQRYYEDSGSAAQTFAGYVVGAYSYYTTAWFKVRKRATPAITMVYPGGNTGFATTAASASNIGLDSFTAGHTASATTNNGSFMFSFRADAEL